MDIAIVAPAWLPIPAPAYGGTEAVIDTLARGLRDAGHSVQLICHPDSTCDVPKASVVPREDTVRMGRASIELEHAIGAYDLIRHADAVHDHTLAGPLLAGRHPHRRVTATVHMPFNRTTTAISRAAAPNVALVAISHAHAASTDVPIDAVVHHGVDVDRFPIGDGGGGYVAVLARMSPTKGIHRAIALARAAGVQLRIAAKMREPEERRYFAERVEPLLGDDVVYLGELEADAKLELLAGAAALLNPIDWPEPFGMAMVESLACGTPVIACPFGAAPEIVTHGETGFLGRTDEELVDGLRSVQRIDRAACRRRVAEYFSAEHMVEGYLRVYRRQL